jgi:pyruvate/2-oxoglutarate dehydrogenase complex dihydrolipoamide dehydrogenase (E3) component
MASEERHYDAVVLGSGPSGRTVSLRLAKNSFSVALVENELVGGDCAYWACIPSKALLRPPEALTEAREVDGSRQAAQGPLSVESTLTRRDTFVDHWNDDNLTKMLQEGGVDIIRGQGKLDGPRRVIVVVSNNNNNNNGYTGSDNSGSNSNSSAITKMLVANHVVVLSTGSSAVIPSQIQGLVEARPWTSRNATSAKKAPHSLAIIGDGAVACEMAHAWWALGTTEVSIISRNKRILNKYEPFVGDRLAQAFKQRGISIHNNVNVRQVKRINSTSKQENGGGSVQIMLDNGNTITAEELLVAVGRKPNTDKLGLETVGLKPGDWLDVDDTCLVNGVDGGGEWLYAIGDINHRALLTHIGKYQARACSTAIITRARGGTHSISNNNHHDNSGRDSGNSSNRNTASNTAFDPSTMELATSDHRAVPQVLFTDPQIASVGLTEESARRLKINVRAVDSEIGTLPGAQLHTDGYDGQAKIVVDEDRHVMVGATFIGPQVGDLLHSATIAIVGQVPLERLWHAIPSFPTVNEVWISLLENYGF